MNTGEFDAAVDRAKAKLDGLKKNFTDTVKIKYDTSQLSSLDKIAREASKINGSSGAMKLRLIDGTKTWAELTAINAEMDHLNGKTARMRVKVDSDAASRGILSFLTGGAGLSGQSVLNPLNSGLLGSPIGIAAIGTGIAALLPELAGLLSGFAAAGAGAGAFAALAAPSIKKVTTAYSGLKTAQQAYQQAQAREKLDPSKANEGALKKAADNLTLAEQAIGKLPSAEQGAIRGIQKLSAEFGIMSRAFQPQVFKVFGDGLKVAGDLLPHLAPFAGTFASGMDAALKKLDKFTQSKGFKDWLNQFHSIEGPALNSITTGVGKVANAFGKLLTVMSGKDVAHAINIAFGGISGIINGITGTIKVLMSAWDGASARFASNAHGIASAFDTVRHSVARTADGIVHTFAAVPSEIKNFYASAGSWLVSAGRNVITGFAKGAKEAWATVSSWFSGLNAKVTQFFSGAGSWLVHAGEAIMSGLLQGIESAWGKVAGFLSSLAGKIKSLKGPLDYDRVMLYPHGQAIMQGLMGGMQSQVPALESQLKGITNKISNTAGHAANGGGEPIHVHVHIDGRQVSNVVAQRAVTTQRRTGHNGMSKRSR